MKDVILEDVLDYILKCKDNDKLVKINDAVKDKFRTNASYLKYTLSAGDTVRINGSGRIESGIVDKVNRTRAIVKVWDEERQGNIKYNVPFTMITKEVSNG